MGVTAGVVGAAASAASAVNGMMSSGGSGNTMVPTGSTTNSPWGPLGSMLTQGYSGISNLLNSDPITPYPNSPVADVTPTQADALNAMTSYGLSGDPVMNSADPAIMNLLSNGGNNSYLTAGANGANSVVNSGGVNPITMSGVQGLEQTASGAGLNANPYVNAEFNQAAAGVDSSVASQFEGAGRFGSGALASSLGSTNNNLATNIYGSNYANELQLQQQAQTALGSLGNSATTNTLSGSNILGQAGQVANNSVLGAAGTAPSLANQNYAELQNLYGVGSTEQGIAQNYLNADVNRYTAAQQDPYTTLQNYMGLIGSLPGYGTSTSSTATNPTANSLGAISGLLGNSNISSLLGSSGSGLSGLFSGINLTGGLAPSQNPDTAGGFFGIGGSTVAPAGGLT